MRVNLFLTISILLLLGINIFVLIKTVGRDTANDYIQEIFILRPEEIEITILGDKLLLEKDSSQIEFLTTEIINYEKFLVSLIKINDSRYALYNCNSLELIFNYQDQTGRKIELQCKK